MKLAVVGPENSIEVIRHVVEQSIPDIEIVSVVTAHYEDTDQYVNEIQKNETIEAILFTGPTNYDFAIRRVKPVIPWGYLPHSKTSLLQAFLIARNSYNSNLKAISVDRYEAALVIDTLESCGIHDVQVYTPPYQPEDDNYEQKLLEYHRNQYTHGLVSICFTSMEHIMEPLLAEGIPCIRIFASDEVIREQIYLLQLHVFSMRENAGRQAVICVQFDYIFDSEKDLSVREWEKIQYQNSFREKIYELAQRMEAAVFSAGTEIFYLACTRKMLNNVFLKKGEHNRLIQFGRRGPEYRVWVGIGLGNTMLEAKSRASMAMNKSVSDRMAHSYLVEDEVECLETETVATPEDEARYLAGRIGVSMQTLRKLSQAAGENADPVTTDELAARMGLTVRSVNRIILKLEEQGYVTIVGHRSRGKGRPARVMKIRQIK